MSDRHASKAKKISYSCITRLLSTLACVYIGIIPIGVALHRPDTPITYLSIHILPRKWQQSMLGQIGHPDQFLPGTNETASVQLY